ncbi:MAG: hypothetical protein Q9219_003370 [cf. Caloplaca sp. 3 TL-2023]
MPTLRARSSPLKFFASSSTSEPQDRRQAHQDWEKQYLNDLRANRPARPSGARPPPQRILESDTVVPETPLRTSSAMSFRPSLPLLQTSPSRIHEVQRCSSALSQRKETSPTSPTGQAPTSQTPVPSNSYISSAKAAKGRPLAQAHLGGARPRELSSSTRTSSVLYRESGQRLAEEEEARMLREALELIDLEEQARLHAAAQAEASELVWKHSQGDSSSKANIPYLYKQRLLSKSHGRSHSDVPLASNAKMDDVQERITRPASEESKPRHGEINGNLVSKAPAMNSDINTRPEWVQTVEQPEHNAPKESIGHGNCNAKSHILWDSPHKKAYLNLAFSIPQVKLSGRRRSSGSKVRTPSGSLFRNPNDKIYEEPEQLKQEIDPLEAISGPGSLPLKSKPTSKAQSAAQSCPRSMTDPVESKGSYSRTEIHRNPPSQSRNPSYRRNEPPPMPSDQPTDNNPQGKQSVGNGGVEVRGDDIRAATSMKLRDRSSKLPSPTVVSDAQRRPIVSFDKHWTPSKPDLELGEALSQGDFSKDESRPLPAVAHSKPPAPKATASAPVIPTINIPEPPSIEVNGGPSIPSISVSTIPSISISSEETSSASNTVKSNPPRPLPNLSGRSVARSSGRPLPHHSSTAPVHTSAPHWSLAQRRATAQCAACALPISGRIVSASSQRFHPECFTCFHCSEQLECVAFYPEPDTFRSERVGRVRARAEGAEVPDEPGKTWDEDGDESLRFYCHLDFHEKFSPRCRSCKTPIEGKVVQACGGEWHEGHFFCAQCGDPFDEHTPFVEKDGYAWCLGCHTNRFSGKCRGCKKPVVDLVVRALGGEWHDGCFCCKV